MRSTDGGADAGHDHRPGAQPDVHSLAWHPTRSRPGRYEAGGGGAAFSEDAGETLAAGRRRPRPPLHVVGRRRPARPGALVRLGEHWSLRGARTPGPAGAHLPATRRRAVVCARRRATRAVTGDALRSGRRATACSSPGSPTGKSGRAATTVTPGVPPRFERRVTYRASRTRGGVGTADLAVHIARSVLRMRSRPTSTPGGAAR